MNWAKMIGILDSKAPSDSDLAPQEKRFHSTFIREIHLGTDTLCFSPSEPKGSEVPVCDYVLFRGPQRPTPSATETPGEFKVYILCTEQIR